MSAPYRAPPPGPRVLWEGPVSDTNARCRVVLRPVPKDGGAKVVVELSQHADALGARSWGPITSGWHANVVEVLAARLAEVSQ